MYGEEKERRVDLDPNPWLKVRGCCESSTIVVRRPDRRRRREDCRRQESARSSSSLRSGGALTPSRAGAPDRQIQFPRAASRDAGFQEAVVDKSLNSPARARASASNIERPFDKQDKQRPRRVLSSREGYESWSSTNCHLLTPISRPRRDQAA